MAVMGRFTFLALVTVVLIWVTCFFQDLKSIGKIFDEEGFLEARDSIVGKRGWLRAVRAVYCLSLWGLLHQWLEAVLTEDVEAVENFGSSVDMLTYSTSQLFLQFLYLSTRRCVFTHCPVRIEKIIAATAFGVD